MMLAAAMLLGMSAFPTFAVSQIQIDTANVTLSATEITSSNEAQTIKLTVALEQPYLIGTFGMMLPIPDGWKLISVDNEFLAGINQWSSGNYNLNKGNVVWDSDAGSTFQTLVVATYEIPANVEPVENMQLTVTKLEVTDDNLEEMMIGGTFSATLTIKAAEAPHTHNLTAVDAKAATCSAVGNIAYWQCTGENGCGKLFLDAAGAQETTLADVTTAINPDAHDYDDGVITTEPGCTTTGVKTFTCRLNAQHTYTETLAALGHNFVNGKCTRCGEDEPAQPAYELYVVVDKTTDTDGDGYYDVDPDDTVTADVYIKASSDVQLQQIRFKLTASDKLTAGNASFEGFTLRNGVYYDYGTTVRSLTANTGLKLGTVTYTVGSTATYGEELNITLSDAYVTVYRGTEDIAAAVTGTGVEIATTYTITWDINGTEETTEVPYGEVPTYDKTIDRPGYTFVGWDPEVVAATADAKYTAQWTRNFDFVTEEYRYAGDGQVLLILKADAPETGKCYTYGGEPMFYTEDQYYCASIEGAAGVYVYLIPAADVTNDTAAGKIAVGTGTNETVSRGGDVNSDKATTIADASIVYRMLQEGGSAYDTLSIKQRLEADVSTDVAGATARGSIADVDAIVDIFFGA